MVRMKDREVPRGRNGRTCVVVMLPGAPARRCEKKIYHVASVMSYCVHTDKSTKARARARRLCFDWWPPGGWCQKGHREDWAPRSPLPPKKCYQRAKRSPVDSNVNTSHPRLYSRDVTVSLNDLQSYRQRWAQRADRVEVFVVLQTGNFSEICGREASQLLTLWSEWS